MQYTTIWVTVSQFKNGYANPPEPLDNYVIGVVVSFVHSILPPVFHVDVLYTTHE